MSGIKVLLVEDSEADALLILRELEKAGYEVSHRVAGTRRALAGALKETDWDLLLTDHALPQMTSGDVLQICRDAGVNAPAVIVSGTVSEELAEHVLRTGAMDFICKDNLTRLPRVVRNALEFQQTRQKSVESERKVREQAALLDMTGDAIMVLDAEGRIDFWNRGAQEMYGWTAGEVMGRRMADLFQPHGDDEFPGREELSGTGRWMGELEHVTKEGEGLIVSSRWNVLQEEEGGRGGVLIINTDITRQKELEQQLQRSQRLEAIGALAGGVAHDLNNILAPIVMSAPMLREALSAQEREMIVSSIEVSAKRGADLVRQLLSFGRGTAGTRVVLQLRHLVQDVIKIIRQTFPRSIEIKFMLPGDLWLIKGDPTQLHQVLLNLCVNARDAMRDGGMLSIEAENVRAGGESTGAAGRPGVRLVIRDTGHGIEEKHLAEIFKPFYTTKERGKGTGLGLSMVKSIVKNHGGSISVQSRVGSGTSFEISLPAEPTEVPAEEAPEPSAPPAGGGELLLLVDDEASIREAAGRTLESHGYRVVTCADGIEALAWYAQHQEEVKLVVTDTGMPLMDGAALVRAIKRMKPTARIIATSGASNQGGRLQDMRDLGVRVFLTKPFTTPQLLEAIHGELGAGEG